MIASSIKAKAVYRMKLRGGRRNPTDIQLYA
jgi:hypothetical protein